MAVDYLAAAASFAQELARGALGDAARRVSDDVPSGAMSAERLGEVWRQLTGHLGPLAAIEPRGVIEQDGRHVADLALRFARSEVVARVVLDAHGAVVGFWCSPPRAPTYVPPPYVDADAFAESELVVGEEPWALPATFAVPVAGDGLPVAVLVHGSGPNDRDETIGANRPFRDLAWGLASRGIAVLRYDKRTHAHPTRVTPEVTVEEEVLLDALHALDVARTRERVATDAVFLVGHSLGGTLAPEIARRDGRVAGVALLAAAARPFSTVLGEQLAHLLRVGADAGGASAASPAELERLREQARRLAARELAADEPVLGAPARYFYDLDDRRPLDDVRALRVPVLVLHGERDYQATVEDFAMWGEALRGHPDATLLAYPALNHLFMPGEGTATPDEYLTRTEHVAREVVDDLARWIGERRPSVA